MSLLRYLDGREGNNSAGVRVIYDEYFGRLAYGAR